VLCPKALTDQWRREMWERFRERFTLLTGESISGAYGVNAWLENDRVVASLDLALQDHILPGLEQATWDLVVFDEAHKLAAYRFGPRGKIDKTKRYMLAEKLATRTKHLLLMTATPTKETTRTFVCSWHSWTTRCSHRSRGYEVRWIRTSRPISFAA